jgi:hypothetical protein
MAQPQVPPVKNQKQTKFISVCALTQQDWKTREAKSVVVVNVKSGDDSDKVGYSNGERNKICTYAIGSV